jgi:hypothetical protein
MDVSNKRLPGKMFFFFLAALAELKLVERLNSVGNGWSDGSLPNYRSYVIFALGDKFQSLDGVDVDAERLLAVRTVKEMKRKTPILKWSECSLRAEVALDEENVRGKHVKKPAPKGVDFMDFELKDAAAVRA